MQLSIQNFQLDISWNPQTSCLKLSPWCPATAPPHLLLLLSAQFWLFPQPGHLEPSILFQVATTIHPLEWLNINEKKKKKKDNRKHWYDGKETWNSYVLLIRVKLLQFILKYFFLALSMKLDAFELWCWRRLLRVPWTARRSNQSILKEISPGISLEGMMLKLKLEYFGHLMRRVDSLEKTVMLGGIGGRRRRGRQWMRWHHWLYGRESEWTPGVGVGQGGLAWCDSWGRKESDTTERLIWSDKTWTYLAILLLEMCLSKNYVHMYQEISDYIYNNTTHNKSFWK